MPSSTWISIQSSLVSHCKDPWETDKQMRKRQWPRCNTYVRTVCVVLIVVNNSINTFLPIPIPLLLDPLVSFSSSDVMEWDNPDERHSGALSFPIKQLRHIVNYATLQRQELIQGPDNDTLYWLCNERGWGSQTIFHKEKARQWDAPLPLVLYKDQGVWCHNGGHSGIFLLSCQLYSLLRPSSTSIPHASPVHDKSPRDL